MNFVKKLEDSLNTLDIDRYDIFVLVDINIDIALNDCPNTKLVINMFQQLGFKQLIKKHPL